MGTEEHGRPKCVLALWVRIASQKFNGVLDMTLNFLCESSFGALKSGKYLFINITPQVLSDLEWFYQLASHL